jgi:hypothetical protein
MNADSAPDSLLGRIGLRRREGAMKEVATQWPTY